MQSINNRRRFLQTIAGGLSSATLLPTLSNAQKRKPNILLIVSDDQGFHDLGCYGNDKIITPNLDRLSQGGTRLTNFYVTWPACTPSRGSLLTGRYPQRNGTYDMYRNDKPDYGYKYPPAEYEITPERILGMDTREVLIPRMLKESGYVSGIFGKWDLGQLQRFLPLQRGFDEFYGFVNTGIDYYTHERYGVPSMYRNNHPTEEDKGTYCTDLFLRDAMKFMKKNKDNPFFCYVPFNAPHGASVLESPKPVHAPKQYKDMYPPPKTEKERRSVEHMAAITAMDEAIGKMLDWLEDEGLADNTIVIFLSDNGGSGRADNTPLRGQKSQMFEGGLRVPCIIKAPGIIPDNHVLDEFLTSLEVLPTLCSLTDTPIPDNVILDGFDMTEILQGKKTSPRNEMFWKRRGDVAARVGNWKWVDSDKGSGLFNLQEDIAEKHDLSQEMPEKLKEVQDRFYTWIAEMDAAEPRRPFKDF